MSKRPIRLNRYIASAGVASRRAADALIRSGRVTVNGKIADLGTSVEPEKDHVKVDGKLVKPVGRHLYVLLYKPAGYICSLKDSSNRPLVTDLIQGKEFTGRRIYHVGRLDFNSEGLLLLTDDGDFAAAAGHPSTAPEKTYHVRVRGVPSDKVLQKIRSGITIEGKKTRPAKARLLRAKENTWLELTIKEGRNRQIRKMFSALGHSVVKLRRTAIGSLTIKGLKPGQWRFLRNSEIKNILHKNY